MRIAVLGAGSWGTTVASLLAGRHRTTLWAREPGLAEEITRGHTNSVFLSGFALADELIAVPEVEQAVADAELVVVGVPSHAVRGVVQRAAAAISPSVPLVSLAKGLERGSLLRMTQVIGEVLSRHPVAALTGPNLATEILAGKAAATVLASEDPALTAELREVFRRGLLRVYTNHDLIGCELGGALKNVIAIAAGAAEGLGVGDNTRAAVITRGLAELTQLGVAMGGEPATFAGLTGMGDLLATCMSKHSRNRHVGEQLGRGRPLAEILGELRMVAEGVGTAAVAVELGDKHGLTMPISRTINKVINGKLTAREAYAGLRHVPAGDETGPW
jgi:glycerol-3-phosphate dehydrogenase (NAD(P)+)